jgi:hypothetical protein
MKAKTKKPADIGSIDTAALVDKIGSLAAVVADFEKQKKAAVAELLARAGNRKYIDGHLYTATIVAECAVTSLDADLIKTEMGDDWVAEHSKESVRKASVRVAARKTPDQKKE